MPYVAFAAAAVLFLLGASAGRAQDTPANDGQASFNNACRTCHTMRDGDNRLGPNLSGVVGRKAGSVAGYAYSESMKNAGFAWDEAKLDAFIENADAVVPGNNMKPYTGISSPEDRKKIVAFLKDGPSP